MELPSVLDVLLQVRKKSTVEWTNKSIAIAAKLVESN